jgi:uncharacterized protein Veg
MLERKDLSSDLFKIKKNLEDNVGQKVKLTAKKGRKKSVIRQGVIENTYPSIFVIKIDNEEAIDRRVSYSYIDVLTKSVEVVLCEDNKSVRCS